MTVGVVDARLAAGNMRGEPLAMRPRNHQIVAALDDEHRPADRVQRGPTPARLAAATRRSSHSAAQASACGPPDNPQVAKRSNASASASAWMSATTSTTARPGLRVEPPYPA